MGITSFQFDPLSMIMSERYNTEMQFDQLSDVSPACIYNRRIESKAFLSQRDACVYQTKAQWCHSIGV